MAVELPERQLIAPEAAADAAMDLFIASTIGFDLLYVLVIIRLERPKTVSISVIGTRDPFIQQQMLEIAEKWRTMAAFEEKFARYGGPGMAALPAVVATCTPSSQMSTRWANCFRPNPLRFALHAVSS